MEETNQLSSVLRHSLSATYFCGYYTLLYTHLCISPFSKRSYATIVTVVIIITQTAKNIWNICQWLAASDKLISESEDKPLYNPKGLNVKEQVLGPPAVCPRLSSSDCVPLLCPVITAYFAKHNHMCKVLTEVEYF